MSGVRLDRVVTAGAFHLDGGSWEVENNVWLLGDDEEVLVVDAAHDADAILDAVGGRRLVAVVCTHAHDDHVNVAPAVADRGGAPIMLHPDDAPLWQLAHPDRSPDDALSDGRVLTVAGVDVRVLHTPGHAPGAVSLYVPALDTLFSGDTLFRGGPGATGRSFSDFPTIIRSIGERLLTLPPDTVVLTGHGESTSVGEEAPSLEDWIARGH